MCDGGTIVLLMLLLRLIEIGDGIDNACVGDGGFGEFTNGTGEEKGIGDSLGDAPSNSGDGEDECMSFRFSESERGDSLLLREFLLEIIILFEVDPTVDGLLTFFILPCLRFCSRD